MVNSAILRAATGLETEGLQFEGIGDVVASHRHGLLSYLKDVKFAAALNANPHITGVLCNVETATAVAAAKTVIVCADPNWAFFAIVDHLAALRRPLPNVIGSDVTQFPCHVAPHDVSIGEGVLIEPYAVIHPHVRLGNTVVVRAGAVLGLDSFQHQRTTHGLFSPRHDGELVIGDGVEIGSGAAISKGFSYRDTRIGAGSQLDAHVYVGHGAEIGPECIICAGARIMGHVKIGAKAFIGPGAVISSRCSVGEGARVSPGAIVTRAVPAGEHVSGPFAVPHAKWLSFVKSL
jgi:UDP-3-O-[3-hydroxymyristoyl] glucosamine N-acyltransferase